MHSDRPSESLESVRAELARAVRARSLRAVARELHCDSRAIANVIAGVAREGTVLVIAARMRDRATGGPAGGYSL